jgi:hypothetical protein
LRSYLSQARNIDKYAIFLSMGGNDFSQAVKGIEELIEGKPISLLAVGKDKIAEASIQEFIGKLGAKSP